MSSFPERLEPGERVLFRLEPGGNGSRLTLLVQSLGIPDWSWLAGQAARGYLASTAALNPQVKSFELQVRSGQHLAFRLRANPTVKRSTDQGEKRRFGLYRESEQAVWLQRKAQAAGFRLLAARTCRQDTVLTWIGRGQARHRARLLAVQFDGVLQVVDPQLLADAVTRGIGSAKGLGFGLLSLAPVRA